MSVILITTLLYKALILQGEIWCWSLLGIKELTWWGGLCALMTLEATSTWDLGGFSHAGMVLGERLDELQRLGVG